MIIRSAVAQDVPAIVDLLKRSLGESVMPKSEAFWQWKHVDNPFGQSPVLLAFENDQLIGVRAFMRWEWRHNNKIYKAVRAVDTATHPDHQGKGIFKKLTLQLVQQCKDEGVDFIFNTPNKSSKPGYLKMGWVSNGKLKLRLKPVLNFSNIKRDFDKVYGIHSDSLKLKQGLLLPPDVVTAQVTESFLMWRYGRNPNVKYYRVGDGETYVTIFRLKSHRIGTEFRVCDSFRSQGADPRKHREHVREAIAASGARFVSSTDAITGLSLTLAIGPEITVYPLSINHNFLPLSFWKPSMGDMEVF